MSAVFGAVSLFLTAGCVYLLFSLFGGCGREIYNTYTVSSSDWILETHGPSCYMGGSPATDLTARNTVSGKIITIATGDLTDVTSIDANSAEVVIHLRNRSFVYPASDSFGETKVVYDYQPYDDPADRASFRHWMAHQQEPADRAWWCRTIYPTLNPASQSTWNGVLSSHLSDTSKPSPTPPPYCPP